MVSGRFARAVTTVKGWFTRARPMTASHMDHADPAPHRVIPFTSRRRPENTRQQLGARGRRRQRSARRRHLACRTPWLPPREGHRRPQFCAPVEAR